MDSDSQFCQSFRQKLLLEKIMDFSNLPPEFADAFKRMSSLLSNGENLLKRYTAGERDFREINLSGSQIFTNANLSGIDLSRAYLNSVDFSGANLSNANFEGAILKNAQLHHANLSGANLKGADLTYASLVQADLTDAILTDVNLESTTLTGCIMPDGTQDPALERVMNAVENYKRSAWKPVVSEGDGDYISSKFGGKPWLNASENWPCCSNCGLEMRFFFQLNLEDVPEKLRGKFGQGMLQLFYCVNDIQIVHEHPTPRSTMDVNLRTGEVKYTETKSCELDCLDSPEFSTNKLVRIVPVDGVPAEFEIPKTGLSDSLVRKGEFPPKTIIGWQEIDDYPHSEDMQRLGIDLSPDDSSFMHYANIYPQGDKLGGWPNWVQDNEYPDCPVCNRQMKQLIFQLESNDNIPFMWGDCGSGYILQCVEHKDQVAFLWQCS